MVNIMDNNENKIITIDISSNSVKIGLVSEHLKLEFIDSQKISVINEDLDGFAKKLDMDNLWNKINDGINRILKKCKPIVNIIGISSCTQRIATVFLDNSGDVIYGGPNIDIRGIDSAYIIDDEFSERALL